MRNFQTARKYTHIHARAHVYHTHTCTGVAGKRERSARRVLCREKSSSCLQGNGNEEIKRNVFAMGAQWKRLEVTYNKRERTHERSTLDSDRIRRLHWHGVAFYVRR